MIKKISQLNRLRKSTFYLLNIRHNSKLQTEILTSEANAIFNFVFIIELVLKKTKTYKHLEAVSSFRRILLLF